MTEIDWIKEAIVWTPNVWVIDDGYLYQILS
jgi:hypothetical protein